MIVAWQDKSLVSLAKILQNSLEKPKSAQRCRAAIEDRDCNL